MGERSPPAAPLPLEAPGGAIEGTELEQAASCVFELGPPPSPPS